MARSVDVTITARTSAPPDLAFDTIAPIDLTSIFERFLAIPGVVGVRDQTGPWANAAGQTRTILLGDGTEVAERLDAVDRPRSFAYRVGPFPRPLGLLASTADGDWLFSPAPGGGTDIRWTYRFTPRPGRGAVTRALIAPMWRGYARRALDRAVAAADAAAGESPSLGAEFARALAAKDVARLRGLLHPAIDFRGMTPNRTWEAGDPDDVLAILLGAWFEPHDEIRSLDRLEGDAFADRERVGYRFAVRTPKGEHLVEQQAYLAVSNGRITWLRVLCSGFRPV